MSHVAYAAFTAILCGIGWQTGQGIIGWRFSAYLTACSIVGYAAGQLQ